MRTPDDIDLAGMAYLITEYDELSKLLAELGDDVHGQKAEHCREKRDNLARHFAHHFDLGLEGEALLAHVRRYREQHSGDTMAYLTRTGQI
jgi:hypothetical protein